jgi:hypothetical protein
MSNKLTRDSPLNLKPQFKMGIGIIPKFITPALCARLKIKDFQDTNAHLKMNIGIRSILF